MTELSATSTLTSYINNTELQESPTSSLPTTYSSETSTPSPSLQTAINKQLNDLKIQFKNGIKHLQYKEPSLSLQPSFSMPQLPLFCDKSFNQKLKMNKKKRQKTMTLIPFQEENINIINLSTSPSSTSSSMSTVKECRNNIVGIQTNEINQKLDVLINIINSQQKLLEHLITQKNVKKKQKKAKTKSKSTQTNNMPHIIQSDASKQDSPVLPPIPHSQTLSNNDNNSNMLVPYNTLLKLISDAANNQHRAYQDHAMPRHQQYMYPANNNNNNNNPNLLSPKSTLFFSEC